jgi:hypothetical protein
MHGPDALKGDNVLKRDNMIRILALVLPLAACTQDIKLTYYTDSCQDWDFNTPQPELRIEKDGADVVVTRMGVVNDCNGSFQPLIQATGWTIQIYEDWTVEEPSDCTMCFAPTVVLKAPPSGEYTIQWFPEPNVIRFAHEEVVVVED